MQVHEYDDKDKKRIVKSKIRKSNKDTNTNYYTAIAKYIATILHRRYKDIHRPRL
jgi:hypothetical protein